LALDASLRAETPLARRFASNTRRRYETRDRAFAGCENTAHVLDVQSDLDVGGAVARRFEFDRALERALDAAVRASVERDLTGVRDQRAIDVLQHSRGELNFLGGEMQFRIGMLEPVELKGRVAEDVLALGFFRRRFRVRGRGARTVGRCRLRVAVRFLLGERCQVDKRRREVGFDVFFLSFRAIDAHPETSVLPRRDLGSLSARPCRGFRRNFHSLSKGASAALAQPHQVLDAELESEVRATFSSHAD
jgi:hypothetical protein